jgi:NAD(P)H-dependent flavin oxidoreductase YrpB (nitropropane dioxygenase family)
MAPVIETPLSRRLGIRVPVMQAGMGGIGQITLARLAAAVSNAGALGTIAHPVLFLEYPGDSLTEIDLSIKRVKAQILDGIATAVALIEGDRPLAINIRVAKEQPDAELLLHAILEERARDPRVGKVLRVLVSSGGHPHCFGLNEEIRKAGMLHFHAASTVKQAQSVEAEGCDAVVATGYEAAGHIGHRPVHTFILTPAVADAVSIPVITSGGLADGRSLAGALALGAQLGYMGTRLLAATECEYHEASKEYIVAADETASTVIPCFYGPARFLSNPFTDRVVELAREGISDIERMKMEGQALRKGAIEGDKVGGLMIGGQVAGRIKTVKPAAEIIADIEREAVEHLGRLASYRTSSAEIAR